MPSRLTALASQFADLQQRGLSSAAPPNPRKGSELIDRMRAYDDRLAAPKLAIADLQDAHEALAAEKYASAAQAERHRSARHLLDQRQREALAEERRALREAEVRLARQTDERAVSVHAAIAHEKREREEMDATFAAEIGELAAQIRSERVERERRMEALQQRHESTVRVLQQALQRERDAHSATVGILDDLLERVRAERTRQSEGRRIGCPAHCWVCSRRALSEHATTRTRLSITQLTTTRAIGEMR